MIFGLEWHIAKQCDSPYLKKDGQLRLTPQGGKIRWLAKGEWGFPTYK